MAVLKERKVVPINNPSDLVVSKDRKFLYSIADEGVEAFKVRPDGDLEAREQTVDWRHERMLCGSG